MKYPLSKHAAKSLRELTLHKQRKQDNQNKPPTISLTSQLVAHPRTPGTITFTAGDSLAPVKLTINKKVEFFLWHTENTDLHGEFLFSLQLLNDLNLTLTKSQLIETAYKCALSIREQVQQYRETTGAVHSVQGQHGEQLIPLQFQGQGFQWDLNCRENSPELFARSLCSDMKLPETEHPNIAVKLRIALKSHKMRLSSIFNEAVAGLPLVRMCSDGATLDQLELENSLQEILPKFPQKTNK